MDSDEGGAFFCYSGNCGGSGGEADKVLPNHGNEGVDGTVGGLVDGILCYLCEGAGVGGGSVHSVPSC